MKRTYLIAGGGVFAALLAGWVALASAQSLPGRGDGPPAPLPGPATEAPPIVPPASGPVRQPESSPPAGILVSTPVEAPISGPRPAVMPPADGAASLPAPAAKAAADDKVEATISADNPTGKQEPAVSIEWGGTSVAKVGQAGDYSLIVRNACSAPVQQVTVRVRVPAGLTVKGSQPQAAGTEPGMLLWDLGTLVARQERVLTMRLVADAKGDVTPQAWVTFTGSSAMRIHVREPKLAVKCSTQGKVLVGDTVQFTLTVSNPGDGAAEGVKVKAMLSEGLEHASGNTVTSDVGSLAPGESRSVTLLCAARVGGAQKCEAFAEADGQLGAKDTATVNVIMPRLDLQLVGPGLRYLDRKAIYTLKVTNPGDAPATNVVVADIVPPGFKVLAASDGGRHDYQTRTVSWYLGEVGPGQAREVKFEVQAISPGEHMHKATAVGARGLKATSELQTRVEGLSALHLEIYDTEDPIEVNGETSYEVRITNTGSKTETNIKLVATIPDQMKFKSAQGPVRHREEGQTVIFEPVERLAPKADAIFRIHVKTMEAGTVRFKIQVTSTNLKEPVIKMEPTNIYSDDAPAAAPAKMSPKSNLETKPAVAPPDEMLETEPKKAAPKKPELAPLPGAGGLLPPPPGGPPDR